MHRYNPLSGLRFQNQRLVIFFIIGLFLDYLLQSYYLNNDLPIFFNERFVIPTALMALFSLGIFLYGYHRGRLMMISQHTFIALTWVFSGALGNFFDVVWYGAVVDYWQIFDLVWFNLSDVWVTIGLLLICRFFIQRVK